MIAMLSWGMATLIIRKLDDRTKAKLRERAAEHGHSMEAEAREILRAGLRRQPGKGPNLVASIRARFEPLGGITLPVIARDLITEPPDFR
jgi:antitoxin FitA